MTDSGTAPLLTNVGETAGALGALGPAAVCCLPPHSVLAKHGWMAEKDEVIDRLVSFAPYAQARSPGTEKLVWSWQ